MNKFFLLTSVCAAVSLFSACTNHQEVSLPDADGRIIMTATDFAYETGSRVSLDMTENGAEFQWGECDTVGVFPDRGHQVDFPMLSGAGTKTASFDGGGWALKPSSTYAAYYPYNFFNRDKKSIPVSFEGQTQVGNASTAHLGQYDYMAAVATTPTDGTVCFNFKHLGALVALDVTLPKAGSYTRVTLNCDEMVFPCKGTVDITSANPEFVASGSNSTQLTVNLENFVTTRANETVKIYFMTAPVNLTGKEIKVRVDGSSPYEGIVQIGKLLAGFSYAVKVVDNPTKPDDKPQWVDLGLPSGVLWASVNVGASRPEDYGYYFAWGETARKSSYDQSNSLTFDKVMTDFSGDAQYDAATANWGEPARMPTRAEIDELIDNCTSMWKRVNGVSGRLVTGPNGNQIFLPAAGFVEGRYRIAGGDQGCYHCSTPRDEGDFGLFMISCSKDGLLFSVGLSRSVGLPVRPVRN